MEMALGENDCVRRSRTRLARVLRTALHSAHFARGRAPTALARAQRGNVCMCTRYARGLLMATHHALAMMA